MKLSALMFPAVLTLVAASAGAQTIIKGPVYNPVTNSRYYIVQAPNWNAARAQAVAMGGELVAIDNAAENEWIKANLAAPNYKVFIGLNDAATEGKFVWSSGSMSSYVNWHPNNQNSASNDYVYMEPSTGKWLTGNQNYEPYSIVEISGPMRVPQEFPTFTDAVSFVNDRLTEIQLAPGDIPLGAMSSFSSSGVSITVTGAGAGVTRLLGSASGDYLTFAGSFIFRDMTFHRQSTHGHVPYMPSGIHQFTRCSFTTVPGTSTDSNVNVSGYTQASFDACRFEDLPYGGIYNPSNNSTLKIGNSIFRNIGERAMYLDGKADIVNCTMTRVGNEASSGVIQGGGDCGLLNCILWNNLTDPVEFGFMLTMSYCDVQGGYPGVGNIDADPMFTSVTDLRPKVGSPCIDAADGVAYSFGLTDCGGGLRVFEDSTIPNTGRGVPLDMGAFERQSSSCPADFDGSGFVDTDDFTAFVQAFESGC